MTLLAVTLALVRLLGALVFIDFALGPRKRLRYPVIAAGWCVYAASPLLRIASAAPGDIFSLGYGLTATVGVLVVTSGIVAYQSRYPLRLVLLASAAIAAAALLLWLFAEEQTLLYYFHLVQFLIMVGIFSRIFFNLRMFTAIGGRSYYWAVGIIGVGALHALAYPAFYSFYPDIPLPFALTTIISVMLIIFYVYLEHTISLKEKEGLLAEVHHRVRNNLQLIESLLHIQGAYRSPEEYETMLHDVYQKIHSIALIHEMVYEEGEYGSFNVSAYAHRLHEEVLGAHQDAPHISCRISADPVFVAIERVIPMGMVLQETLTNAVTHGAKGRNELSITIEIWESARGTGCIRVADDGPGFPEGFDPYNAATLGYILIAQLVRQIGGRFLLEEGGGAQVFVEFPL